MPENRMLDPDYGTSKKNPELECEACLDGIYEGDRYYEIFGEIYCCECAEQLFTRVA